VKSTVFEKLCRVLNTMHTANTKKHTANVQICRVPELAHGKSPFCRVQQLCRVPLWQHTAKRVFAMCPILST